MQHLWLKAIQEMLIVEGFAQYGDRLEIVPADSCDAFEIRAWIRDWEKNKTFYPGELLDLSFSLGDIPVLRSGRSSRYQKFLMNILILST